MIRRRNGKVIGFVESSRNYRTFSATTAPHIVALYQLPGRCLTKLLEKRACPNENEEIPAEPLRTNKIYHQHLDSLIDPRETRADLIRSQLLCRKSLFDIWEVHDVRSDFSRTIH